MNIIKQFIQQLVGELLRGMYPGITQANDSMQKVELFISARNLLDMDFFSKSDPYAKVYFKQNPNHQELYLGRTQTVLNNLNPNFQKSFKVDYVFEAHQQLRFQIFDEDNNTNDKNDDYLGQATCSLGAIAGAKSQTLIVDILNINTKKNAGKLIIRLQKNRQSNVFLKMKWRAAKLLNTDSFFDFWDKSDPYLKFIKIRSDNSFLEVHRTQVVPNNLNPSWKPLEISMGRLFPENQSNKFKIQCWDWEQDGEHKHNFIGQAYIDLLKLKQQKKRPIEFALTNPKHKNPGKILLQQIIQTVKPGFLDYLKGGLQLNLSVAIDFTGSNGIPTQPSSLHYINPYKPNQYQTAIMAISRILLNYDSDKKIPCYAFGGKPRFPNFMSNTVSHCFPLSGNPTLLQAYGQEHLLQMYNQALSRIQLSGPTYFQFILKEAIRIAAINANEGSNTYQIMLILTDGQIHDMDQTIDLLVENCNLPLSLIIVGVGNADFTNMVRLDGDNGLYSSKGKKAYRDIVQFVPFRQVQMNSDLLARELLAELPDQVVQYMKMINKLPNPPIMVNPQMTSSMLNPPPKGMQNEILNLFNKANFFQPN